MNTASTPLISVILAAHDAELFLRPAVESVLRQSLSELELIVIDDGSRDGTPELLASFGDPRLVLLRNEERQGLATSLNRGLDTARGRYVARLDADDIAMPRRLERQLAGIRTSPGTAILGSSVRELRGDGRPGTVHAMPASPLAVRWHLLFSSPFFHPTVLLDRELLERAQLRYDLRFLESEDYDLWTRVLELGAGTNDPEPLVLYRVHPGQASQSRRELQRTFQLEIARREISRVAPGFSAEEAELAWSVGAGERPAEDRLEEAVSSYVELAHAFESRYPEGRGSVREAAALALGRVALAASGGAARAKVLQRALELDVALPLHAGAKRVSRLTRERATRLEAETWLATLDSGEGSDRLIRVAAVFPEPTPYRAPLLDRVAALPELDLTVIYAARTVAGRTWVVEPQHHAIFLRGVGVPGAKTLLHHEYPLTPGVAGALSGARPDVVVVSGWSTFAAQAAIAWCRVRKVPYVLVVESHDEGPRAGWRRTVKGTVVPPIVRGAAGALVTGSLARRSMIERGAKPEQVHVFANTIDVGGFEEHADRLAARRPELRESLGVSADDVAVLSVARLVPEKAHDVLVRAVAAVGDTRLVLVLAGDGPERGHLEVLAQELGARVLFAGDVPWERIAETYVAADIFALLSEREPWAVVVNEAAASGLPLVLSDRVGAAHDLLHDGENGMLVRAGDVTAAAAALSRLAVDPDERRRMGARSRELVRDWGYEPSVAGFLAAVRDAANRHRRR